MAASALHPRRYGTYSKQLLYIIVKNNYFTYMCSGSEAGSYSRLIDLCITQLYA